MKIMQKKDNQDLDALLLQATAPHPSANFNQDVWRKIRCTEAEAASQAPWHAAWFLPAMSYGVALLLVAGALLLGQHAGRFTPAPEPQITILQPHTLSGAYLAVNAGR
jgi:hypothetical protein